MVELIEITRYTNETLEWAAVQGKHAGMHYLHDRATVLAHNLMEHIGIDPDASHEHISNDGVLRRSATEIERWRAGNSKTVTKLVPLGERSEESELGLNYEFARIQEEVSFSTHSVFSRLYLRPHRLARKQEKIEPKVEHDSRTTQISVQRYAGTVATDPLKVIAIPDTRVEMIDNRLELDARKFSLMTPEDMTGYYSKQIAKLAIFMDEIKGIAEAADYSTWPRHIASTLPSR